MYEMLHAALANVRVTSISPHPWQLHAARAGASLMHQPCISDHIIGSSEVVLMATSLSLRGVPIVDTCPVVAVAGCRCALIAPCHAWPDERTRETCVPVWQCIRGLRFVCIVGHGTCDVRDAALHVACLATRESR